MFIVKLCLECDKLKIHQIVVHFCVAVTNWKIMKKIDIIDASDDSTIIFTI